MSAFRVEHVGSFVRPPRLLEAARAHKNGSLDGKAFLRATMVPASLIPVRCWIAPEIPMATYKFGLMAIPV